MTDLRYDIPAFAETLRAAIDHPQGDGWKNIAYYLEHQFPGGMTAKDSAAVSSVLAEMAWFFREETKRLGGERNLWIHALEEFLENADGLTELAEHLAFSGYRLTSAPDLGLKAMLSDPEPSPAGIAEYARIQQMCAEAVFESDAPDDE